MTLRLLTAACLIALSPVAGCRYERIVSQSGLLVGLEGAQSGIPPKRESRPLPDFLRTPDEGIRVEDEDGAVTLYSKSVRQLMTHIVTTVGNGERELFLEQLLSQRTKDEFIERGLDPGLAFDELVNRQRDIGRLFYFIPMGEFTPGVYFETIGRNVFRLKLPNKKHAELYWVGIDVVFEDYNYRLRWFLPNG
ncbi:MAG: hypothetical protein NXI07_08635 [bacterium]|nr:hypothetical protein [bacterium]